MGIMRVVFITVILATGYSEATEKETGTADMLGSMLDVLEKQVPFDVGDAIEYTDQKLNNMDSKFNRLSNLVSDEDLKEFPRIAALLKQGREMAETLRKENKQKSEGDEECDINEPPENSNEEPNVVDVEEKENSDEDDSDHWSSEFDNQWDNWDSDIDDSESSIDDAEMEEIYREPPELLEEPYLKEEL